MSVLQSKMREVRFMKRKNLEEEAKVIGNYFSDLITNYGIDCLYRKLDTKVFGDYHNIVDKNTILKHAYGQNDSPDYSCSAMMITYPEVVQNIFNMQKFGYVPQDEIDFNFDSKQFACDLAARCGQLKEYKVKDMDVYFEVPDPDLSAQFPYQFQLKYDEFYECGVLKGKLSAELSSYEYDTEYEVMCHAYSHSSMKTFFPKNDDLYASLEYKICNDDYIETLIFLTYKVVRTAVDFDFQNKATSYKNILQGKIHGSVLFFDVNTIGKYIDKIHPEVGDILTIDFPDDKNREQYEITDCYDKSLQSDGISPLLHKYIWKCKARRYVNSYEDTGEENEANARLEEKVKHQQVVDEQIAEKISIYDEGDQEAYGGYDGVIDNYDKERPSERKALKFDYLSGDTCLDVFTFGAGSKLITNGYDLIFVTASDDEETPGDGYVVAMSEVDHGTEALFESGLRWLKASKDKLVFVNIEGENTTILEDYEATKGELELCLNDLNEKTLDVGEINSPGQNFIKFKESRSCLWATRDNLFARLESNGHLYKIA